MSRVIYFAYYSDPDTDKARMSVPAAVSKIDYIADVIRSLGHEPQIWSLCEVNDRSRLFVKYPGYVRSSNGVVLRFFDRYSSRFKLIRGAALLWSEHRIKKQVLNTLEKGDKVIIYHSLSSLYLIRALKKHGVAFALEAEEIYSDVTGKPAARRREVRAMREASAYVLPTKLLSRELNPGGKPEAIVHGVYREEPPRGVTKFGSEPGSRAVHCVYAGTLDPRKGGAEAAVRAAALLPEDHHMHILGFGSEKEIGSIRRLIDEVSARSKALVTYDGLLKGEEYVRFLQRCDVGLSTQSPDAAFNDTSFPSKILSYLSNGLKVVSVRIPAVETSAIGGCVTYYDEQTPEAIAEAIRLACKAGGPDGREGLNRLSDAFSEELRKVLDSI